MFHLQLGGLLSIWKQVIFDVQFSFSSVNFVGVCFKQQNILWYIVKVYSSCNIAGKRCLWNELRVLKSEFVRGDWCVAGDFNAVVSVEGRRGDSASFNQTEKREFKYFIDDIELIDVLVLGKKFSCFGSDGRSMSRIDCFLLSEGLIARWNISSQWIGDRYISDHCPVWWVSSSLNWGPKPSKFNNCWLEHKDFKKFVQVRWPSFQIKGRCDFVVTEKLKLLKEKLRWWNGEVFGFKNLQLENIVEELNDVERLASKGESPKVEQRKALCAEFWQEMHIRESLLAQKSRSKWIAMGDSNTRFFHSCIKGNRRKTQLLKLKVNDEWIEDVQSIK